MARPSPPSKNSQPCFKVMARPSPPLPKFPNAPAISMKGRCGYVMAQAIHPDAALGVFDGPSHQHEGALRICDGSSHHREAALGIFDGQSHQHEGGLRISDGSSHHPEAALGILDGPSHQHEGGLRISDGSSHHPEAALGILDGPSHQHEGGLRISDGSSHHPEAALGIFDGPSHHSPLHSDGLARCVTSAAPAVPKCHTPHPDQGAVTSNRSNTLPSHWIESLSSKAITATATALANGRAAKWSILQRSAAAAPPNTVAGSRAKKKTKSVPASVSRRCPSASMPLACPGSKEAQEGKRSTPAFWMARFTRTRAGESSPALSATAIRFGSSKPGKG